jgi:hypothetical protein
MFWRRWFIWPMTVAGVSFKCLLMASSVRPGQVSRCPSLTVFNIAAFVGLKKALCKIWIKAPVLRNSYTLFAMGSGMCLLACFKLIRHRPVVSSRGPLNSLALSELQIVTVSCRSRENMCFGCSGVEFRYVEVSSVRRLHGGTVGEAHR